MARPVSTNPTAVELQILRILWELGPGTARRIHERLHSDKGTNYSTTVKMLGVMLEKGLVKRDESASPLVYRAAMTQERAQKRMLTDLLQSVYEGSSKSLVMHALSAGRASREEIEEIRRMLDQLEGDQP